MVDFIESMRKKHSWLSPIAGFKHHERVGMKYDPVYDYVKK